MMLIASLCSLVLMNSRVCAICQQLTEALALASWVPHSLQRVQRSIWERRCIQLLPRSRPHEQGLGDDPMRQQAEGGCIKPAALAANVTGPLDIRDLKKKNTIRNARLVSILFGLLYTPPRLTFSLTVIGCLFKTRSKQDTQHAFSSALRAENAGWLLLLGHSFLIQVSQCCPPSAWLNPIALYWSPGRASRVLSQCLIFTHTHRVDPHVII